MNASPFLSGPRIAVRCDAESRKYPLGHSALDAVLHVILRCDAVLYVIPHLMRNPGIPANGPRIAVRGDPV